MLKSQVSRKESLLLRSVAAIAYMSCLLQWFWAMVLYLPLIRDSNVMELFINEPDTHEPVVQPTAIESSGWVIALAVVFTVLLITLTVYALVKTPGAIRKTGNKVTHTTAKKYIVPAIAGKKHLPQKKLRVLTLKVEYIIKLSLVILALGVSLFAYVSPLPLEYRVIMVTSGLLAAVSFVFFTLEFCLKIQKRAAKKS